MSFETINVHHNAQANELVFSSSINTGAITFVQIAVRLSLKMHSREGEGVGCNLLIFVFRIHNRYGQIEYILYFLKMFAHVLDIRQQKYGII